MAETGQGEEIVVNPIWTDGAVCRTDCSEQSIYLQAVSNIPRSGRVSSAMTVRLVGAAFEFIADMLQTLVT